MPQTLFPQSAVRNANLTAEQRETLGIRSEMMELIVGARHAIAQSRILLAEADILIARNKPPKLGTLPQSEKIPV